MDKENPKKRQSTENLLQGWVVKKQKPYDPSKSPPAKSVKTQSLTQSMEKISISPRKTPTKETPKVNAAKLKLDFNIEPSTSKAEDSSKPPTPKATESVKSIWSFVKSYTKKGCLDEMRRAGLDESEKWKSTSLLGQNPAGYTYLWFKKCDWESIEALDTLQDKVSMMIDTVLYVGVDVDFGRFAHHLSPYQIGSPFDRYLKVALSNGEEFVAVYFGKKSNKNLVLESLLIAKLKLVKSHQKSTKLFNVLYSSLDKFIEKFNSNEFMSVLVYLFADAVTHPVRIMKSKDHHVENVKDYFAKMQILQNNRFEMFIEHIMNLLVQKNGQLKCDKVADFTDKEFDCFMGKMLNCKIVKRETGGKLVPYIAVSLNNLI